MDQAPVYDVAVIGGGINGCGIARDAAGRGYSVFLAEMGDLGGGTSSASTKLIHGGLRYLEHYEFRLVREALKEREVLWSNAPHIIRPMRFVLPYAAGLRPAWLLRLGLFLYDHMGGRRLMPPTRTVDLRTDPAGKPLKPGFRKAFEYSDGWVDDSRLVILNARDAADKGAVIRTRTAVTAASRNGAHWVVTLEDRLSGEAGEVRARLLVNASGPWIDKVMARTFARSDVHNVRLVQGSHIVVRKKFDDPRAYFFQNGDGRILFAIPYEDDFTLIGTTDSDYAGDPREARITAGEISYLCAAASDYFSQPVEPADIVHTYSGVRPLYDDGATKAQEATRGYVLTSDAPDGDAPLLNVVGGKITTYRRLAEAMLGKIEHLLGRKGAAWTKTAPLPGGDFPATGFDAQVAALRAAFPFVRGPLARRLTRLYGTLARDILGSARAEAELGQRFGADLYEAEVRYLMDREWARTSEDILWRRTKLGLTMTEAETGALATWLAGQTADR